MQLIYEKLPADISDRHVLLLDPILGTGESVPVLETFFNLNLYMCSVAREIA